MESTQGVFQLKGVVQNYSWGGFEFIPALLGIENKEQKPFAEYWLGAHPNHPSLVVNGQAKNLASLIEKEKKALLGENVAKRFSSLPFLLKILDVRQMLSIQVHPSRASAGKGFEEENKKGIPVNAAHRNYKDENHKPEMMVALGDFWLLHGFKTEKNLEMILDAVPEFGFLKPVLESGGIKALYEQVMLMPQGKVNEVLQPLAERILPLYREGQLQKDAEDFWAARAVLHFCKPGRYDRGIFSVYFFNLVQLKKGEGIFQPEGMPHAYLEGQNVEIMANSDNVLRAGLTDKHIDVPELMKHLRFEPTIPDILEGKNGREEVFYPSPAEEFEIRRYELPEGGGAEIRTASPEILVLLEGTLLIRYEGGDTPLKKGEAVYVKPGKSLRMQAPERSTLFRASVPEKSGGDS